jgi:hypothetical protein
LAWFSPAIQIVSISPAFFALFLDQFLPHTAQQSWRCSTQIGTVAPQVFSKPYPRAEILAAHAEHKKPISPPKPARSGFEILAWGALSRKRFARLTSSSFIDFVLPLVQLTRSIYPVV